MITLCKLVAMDEDSLGYINYVFENLEEDVIKWSKYILATRFPNWETKKVNLGDVGYLQFEEIRAGVDKWFDGQQMIPYNYNMIQFIKFIERPKEEDNEYRM